MTIDERLERLAERHDALTQSVEMLHHEIAALVDKSKGDRRAIRQLFRTAQQDGENIRALARIAEIHERRITALEGGDSDNGASTD